VSDRIRVEGLLARTILGVYEEERREKQDVLVGLDLELDLGDAARSDAIEDSVDYSALAKAVVGHVEETRFRLVERLAGSIADHVLGTFPKVAAVTVRVEKPRAVRSARAVSVEMRRTRS